MEKLVGSEYTIRTFRKFKKVYHTYAGLRETVLFSREYSFSQKGLRDLKHWAAIE